MHHKALDRGQCYYYSGRSFHHIFKPRFRSLHFTFNQCHPIHIRSYWSHLYTENRWKTTFISYFNNLSICVEYCPCHCNDELCDITIWNDHVHLYGSIWGIFYFTHLVLSLRGHSCKSSPGAERGSLASISHFYLGASGHYGNYAWK